MKKEKKMLSGLTVSESMISKYWLEVMAFIKIYIGARARCTVFKILIILFVNNHKNRNLKEIRSDFSRQRNEKIRVFRVSLVKKWH